MELLGRKGPRRGGTRRSAVRSLMGLGNGPESPIHSNENGTVLERQFLLRGLFVEILVAAPFATKDAAFGHWVELGDVVAFLTRRVAVA